MFDKKKKPVEPPAPKRFGVLTVAPGIILKEATTVSLERFDSEPESNDYARAQKIKNPHAKVFVVKLMSEAVMELKPDVTDLQS